MKMMKLQKEEEKKNGKHGKTQQRKNRWFGTLFSCEGRPTNGYFQMYGRQKMLWPLTKKIKHPGRPQLRSLLLIRQQHGSMSSNSAFRCGANSNSNSRDARSFRCNLPACFLTVRTLLLKRKVGNSPLPWTPDPFILALHRGSAVVRSGFVSNWQESA